MFTLENDLSSSLFCVRSIFSFVNEITNLLASDKLIFMVSFDVKSLFTNLPL